MCAAKLDRIGACVFDAYGTLFDVHSAVAAHRARLGEKADRVSATWRTKQLEYTWLRSLMGVYADFWQLTGDALDYALDTHAVGDTGLRADLMDAYLRLQCYPEVVGMLERLKARDLPVAILSNGSPRMLEAAVANAGIAELVDVVLSVDALGVYKPDPRVYALAPERLGVTPEQICFQSSNAWDVAGASSFGFKVVWINRFGQARERLPGGADVELDTLESLPDLLA